MKVFKTVEEAMASLQTVEGLNLAEIEQTLTENLCCKVKGVGAIFIDKMGILDDEPHTKTIKQTGYVIEGDAYIDLWGGGSGMVRMNATFIPLGKFSKSNMLRAVNDGGFGCQRISSADIDIYRKYDNGSLEHDRTLYDVDAQAHTSLFLGWASLREQGINV
jgi:hypothetical protein